MRASAYLVGFTLGVAAVVAGLVAVAEAVGWTGGSGPARWAGIVKLVIGVGLGVAGVQKLRHRPTSPGEASLPRWMEGIGSFSTPRSFAVGVAIGAANPKNLVVGAAAAISIATATLPTTEEIGAVAVYVVVAVLGVAAPLFVTLVLGDRSPQVLGDWRSWLTRYNAVVMATLFLIFAVVLIGQGIASL